MPMNRIGFACKYMSSDQTLKKPLLEKLERPLNTKSTTRAWLQRQTTEDAYERLWLIVKHNIESVKKLIEYVGALPEQLRMVRLGSDILPAYTLPVYKRFYNDEVLDYCDKHLRIAGDIARKYGVRLSMHPGQFTVLASDNPDIVTNSIEEFEYHVDIARWMGYGKSFQDFKINVHISGRQGPAGIKAVLPRLSDEARNTITIENDENSWGLDASLELEKDVALVLDIHHHWIRTGEYIQPLDSRYQRVIDSWRGVRPVIHYSYSRNEHLPEGYEHNSLPDLAKLIEQGCKKQKLRAHSDYYPNPVANAWALSFTDSADIMCESKCKNLASIELFKQSQYYIPTFHTNI
jgi:UV DNA damage endonuclease